MNRRIAVCLLLPAILCGLWLVTPPLAFADSDADTARELARKGVILPLRVIVERAQGVIHGQILKVEFEREHGHYLYEIEALDDGGVVHEYLFDATNGNLIAKEH